MMELFIEGQRLDVKAGDPAMLTFALDDIKDFSSRNTTFSKTIVLPGTANNNRLFGNIFDVRISNPYDSDNDNVSTNFNAAVQAEAIIFQERLQVFKGTLRILQIVIDQKNIEYEVAVFGELGGFVGALGTSKLEDLDFSVYDQGWNASGVLSSWDLSNATGCCFPLIDYGLYSTLKNDWDIRTFRPAFHVREYLTKIFAAANYTYTCDLFNTTRFKNLIIPHNQAQVYNRTPISLQVLNTGHTYSGTASELIAFHAIAVIGGFTSSGGDTIFTYSGATIIGTVDFSIQVQGISNAFAPPYSISILKNGVSIGSFSIILPNGPPDTLTLNGIAVTIATGDTLSVRLTPPPFGSPQLIASITELQLNNSAPAPILVNPGDVIRMNGSIPRNILQKDFVVGIMKLFNLYLYEDALKNKHLMIKPYVDYYDTNVTGITDWTYKVDRSKPMTLKPMSEMNSRYYLFDFKKDSDYYNDLYVKRYNQNYGARIFDSEFEFSSETQKCEILFSGTPLVGYAGQAKVYSTILKLTNGTEDHVDSNIRILQKRKITGIPNWAIKDGVSTLVSGITSYGYAGHFDNPDAPSNDIQFGTPKELFFTLASGDLTINQFNVYWSPYMAEISDKDSKLMQCTIKLTNSDIFNLDFSKFIYIDGSYWRINKIVDWNANSPDVCKAEFLKVINMIY